MNWINVKDRLPDKKDDVLVWSIDDGWITTAMYIPKEILGEGRFYCVYTGDKLEVSHWMPLPEPPEEMEK